MDKLDWDYVDFVYVSGDAYVDHPSFGVAIISRILEAKGYRVAILPQPDIRKVGVVVSAVVGVLAIKFLKWIVSNEKFHYFGYYCLILGVIVIVLATIESVTGVRFSLA